MKKLGLVFGAFDLAIDEQGEYVFFEVNPAGQFLYGDLLGIDLNLLGIFCAFLESGDPNFEYRSDGDGLSINNYYAEVEHEKEAANELGGHFGSFTNHLYARASVKF